MRLPLQQRLRSQARRIAAALACVFITSVAFAANLPPGFEETVVVSGGQLNALNCMAIAPDGTIFIGAGFGWIWTFQNGTLINVVRINVHYEGEAGLSGMTVDPDFATNHHLWVFYAVPSAMRVARFTYTNNALIDEVVMLEWPDETPWHNGGGLRFASDKTLYISTGDDYLRSTTSQNPFDLRGKILHINRDGTPAAGNPFLDGVAGDPHVWALGFRNPFRFSLQPHTDNLFIADVGDGLWEEISIGVAGGNFGWANVEGPVPAGLPGYVYPIYWYDHSDPIGAAIIGGDHADEGDFSEEYHGDYFFADNSRSTIYRMELDQSNVPISTEVWATDAPWPVDMLFGPDGSLYYATYIPGSIRKITYVGGGNGQPVANAIATPQSGASPLVTVLDGSTSTDPDGDELFYAWDLGDGTYSTDPVVSHQYPLGVYEARLMVGDDQGGVDSAPAVRIVSGNHKPVVSLASPQDGSAFFAGQEISYSGVGFDVEDGQSPCSKFAWTVVFHHLGHVHPYLGPIQGVCSGSFVTDERGEHSTDIWYEVRLDVQDLGTPIGPDGILTGTKSVGLQPITTSVTLASSPVPNLQLVVDTQDFVAPRTIDGVLNFVRTIGVVEPQLLANGHTYRWQSWSDGGDRSHEIRLGIDTGEPGSSGSTITATFGCDVIAEARNVRVAKAPGDALTLSWDPAVDPCLRLGPSRYQIYASPVFRPSTAPGSFPDDPGFVLVGETVTPGFTYVPGPDDRYFLVVAVGTDGLPGRSGHYAH